MLDWLSDKLSPVTDSFTGIKELFSQIAEVFGTITEQLFNLNELLIENTQNIQSISASIQTGSLSGVSSIPWLDFIATFRYVVGDGIYLALFAFIVLGISMTLFRLILLIKDQIPLGNLLGKLPIGFK